MRITDRFTLRDKASEQLLRELEMNIENMGKSKLLDKSLFLEILDSILGLTITAYKRLDNNSTPARTLMDFNTREVKDACMRVGPAAVFADDDQFVIAVMKELTKR